MQQLMRFFSALAASAILLITLLSSLCILGIAAISVKGSAALYGLLLITALIPLYSRSLALGIFLFLLPVFGNRPGSTQAFYLLLYSAALTTGIFLSYVFRRRGVSLKITGHPLFVFTCLYVLCSALSLSSLPSGIFYRELQAQIPSWTDISALSYVFLRPIKATEETLAYSYLSVLWTFYGFSLMTAVALECRQSPQVCNRLALSVLMGLVLTLFAGIGDYYGFISLSGLRSLDPVVNPGGEQFRMQSFFGHSGWFAEYVTLTIPFSMLILNLRSGMAYKICLILTILMLGEICLIISFQRGGWVSYPLTLLVIWAAIYSYRRLSEGNHSFIQALRGSALKTLISIPLTLIATLAVFLALNKSGLVRSNSDVLLSRYLHRFGEITKSSDRTEFMQAGFMLGSLYPVLGGGSESFAFQFNREFNQPEGRFYKKLNLPLYGSSHNVYMQTFSGKGLAGLALLLAILISLIISSARLTFFSQLPLEQKILLLICICFSAAFMIYGNVQEVFYVQALQFLFFMVIGMALAIGAERSQLSGNQAKIIFLTFAVALTGHFLWLKHAQVNPPSGTYGCFAKETDQKGREFSWCSIRSLQRIPVILHEGEPKISFSIESGLQRNPSGDSRFKVSLAGTAIYERDLPPQSFQEIGSFIPDVLREYIREEGGFTFVEAEIESKSYFIPARDFKKSSDTRILAFKRFH